jgi:hypothetical protein
MMRCALQSVATICIAMVAFGGSVAAKTSDVSQQSDLLVAQPPTDQADAKMVALQVAIEAKDATAALAFASGALTAAQQANAITVIRNAPAGFSIVANLLSGAPVGGFGFPSVTTVAGLFNLVVTENQNQTRANPN